jgi:predicted DNA binding CopG/RHH family protein
MRDKSFKELRIRLHEEELRLIRYRAAQKGLTMTKYFKQMMAEEKREDKKHDYRLF